MSADVEERVRVLQFAAKMLSFRARVGTVCLTTCLSRKEVEALAGQDKARPGRWPSSNDWYHTARLSERVEASVFAAHYRRNRNNGFGTLESTIDAYGRYLSCIGSAPLISFDRAVDLVCHIEGEIWRGAPRSLDIAVCQRCGAQHLIPIGDKTKRENCVFCKLVERYSTDCRLQTRFPARSLPQIAWPTE